jgi:hypothetical protein
MASKKTGKAAGLAALAGLAYMALSDKNKNKSGTKDTAAENTRIADARGAREEEKGAALFMSGEDERPAPTGMGAATKFVTPAKVARSEKAPSAADLGTIYDETGALSKFRRNTETGELYNPGVSDGGRSMVNLQNAADRRDRINANVGDPGYSEGMKKGGKVKKMASGGMTSSASKRGDGIAQRGKTRGKMY